MLPVFVCLRSVSCVPNVARFWLSSFSVLCTQCCQFLFVFVQCLVYPMLPVSVCLRSVYCVPNVASFVCLRSVSCVPHVASFCLSSFSVLCTQCCQFLFVFVQCLVYPMLPGFVCLRSVSCVPYVASFSGLSILTALRFSPKRLFKAGKYQYSLINLFIFVFFLVFPILLVSLDCSLLIAPSVSLTFIDDILTLISNDIR
jgi:hypothetical protein